MDKNMPVRARVNDVIAVSSVLDQFDNFNQNLKELIRKYNILETIHHLKRATKGGTTFFKKRKIYQFYQENKDIVDTIDKNSEIYMFLALNYENDGTMIPNLEYYYRYLLNHKDEKEQIQALLQRLKETGFEEIAMDEDLDFTKKEYKLETWDYHSRFHPIIYLENLEILPNHETDAIKYRSKGSNYELQIRSNYPNKIIVNNMLFPIENLPKSVSWKSIREHILTLTESKKESTMALKNSVDLDVSLQDLEAQMSNTYNTFIRIDGVNSKPGLVDALTQIKSGITELHGIKRDYDTEITTEHSSLSQQTIKEATKQYVKRRDSMIDID